MRLGDRFGGWELSARLVSTAPSFEVLWRAVLRDGANYLRQQVTLRTDREPLEFAELRLLELAAPQAETVGSVEGSPVRAGNLFAAGEQPMSRNQVLPGAGDARLVQCGYPYCVALEPGRPLEFRSVIGVSCDPAGVGPTPSLQVEAVRSPRSRGNSAMTRLEIARVPLAVCPPALISQADKAPVAPDR